MTKFISLAGLAEFKNKLPDFFEAEGFVKTTVQNLANYYKKSETYTKGEVDELVSTIAGGGFECVSALPSTGQAGIIYLVPKASSQTRNVKDEYIWVNNAWEKIGDTEIDLSNYSTTAEMNAAIAAAVAPFKTEAQIKTIVETYGYVTRAVADATYVEKVSGKGLSTNDFTNTLKTKLEDIEAAAERNKVTDVTVDGTSVVGGDRKAAISTATDSEIDSLFA